MLQFYVLIFQPLIIAIMIETDVILGIRQVTAARLVCLLNPGGTKVAIMSHVTAVAIVTMVLQLRLDQSAGNC